MHWDSISDLATLGMWADPGSYAYKCGWRARAIRVVAAYREWVTKSLLYVEKSFDDQDRYYYLYRYWYRI